jgi:hypothetical protein
LIRGPQTAVTMPLPTTKRAPVSRNDVTMDLLDLARDELAATTVKPS